MNNTTSEFRKLMTWMRLFLLSAFVALSASTSLAVGGAAPGLAILAARGRPSGHRFMAEAQTLPER